MCGGDYIIDFLFFSFSPFFAAFENSSVISPSSGHLLLLLPQCGPFCQWAERISVLYKCELPSLVGHTFLYSTIAGLLEKKPANMYNVSLLCYRANADQLVRVSLPGGPLLASPADFSGPAYPGCPVLHSPPGCRCPPPDPWQGCHAGASVQGE